MKTLKILILIACTLGTGACAYDNYEAPDATFEGSLVYQGTPLNLDAKDVKIELWETGWKKKSKIDVQVNQDGKFSAVLFNGTYKLYIPQNPVPFRTLEDSPDSLLIEINGSREMNIDVTPYYIVKNPVISNTGRMVKASFSLEKIITDAHAKNVDEVFLYVSKSNLVASRNDVGGVVSIKGADITDFNNINLTREIQTFTPDQSYLYARIGVRLSGVQYLIYSPVQKIQL
jgi:hypothetical protein